MYGDLTKESDANFLSPQSIPLNEGSITSANSRSKAWAGWAKLKLDFNGLDLMTPYRKHTKSIVEKLGFILNDPNKPEDDASWTFPVGADGRRRNDFYNTLYESNPLVNEYYFSELDESIFEERILQDIKLHVNLKVWLTWIPSTFKGKEEMNVRWQARPQVIIHSPAGEIDKTLVCSLVANARPDGWYEQRFSYSFDDEGKITLTCDPFMLIIDGI